MTENINDGGYVVKRGRLIIINNVKFDSDKLNDRSGSVADESRLEEMFRRLGFQMVVFRDKSTTEMLQIFIAASREDYSDDDCLAVAVLTHGDEDGMLYGTDGVVDKENRRQSGFINLDKLLAPLKKCSSLFRKPKLIFIQACRGEKVDNGWCHDGHSPQDITPYRIPTEADFLYAYSTPPGHISFRSQCGSWFIQALCDQLQQHLHQLQSVDVVRILTRVNRQVAFNEESCCPFQPELDKKKQVPSFTSMLTSEVYLTRVE